MAEQYFQRIDQKPEDNLSPEEREILQLQEHAELLTKGRLYKHLKKKHKHDEIAMQRFGHIARNVSEFESDMFDHGVLAEATWRYKQQKESGVRIVAGLLIGLLAALIPSGDDLLVEYKTRHRLSPATVRWYFWRKFFLSALYVLFAVLGFFSIAWVAIGLLLWFDPDSSANEKWWSTVPIVISPLLFLAAYKAKQAIIPKWLHIYGGKRFTLVSLKIVNEADR